MDRPLSAKSVFVNGRARFANGSQRRGFSALLAFLAAMLAVLVGAFGTDGLAPPERLLFWIGLVGWNWAKWEALFALLLPRGASWRGILALGGLLGAATVPFEVVLALKALGAQSKGDFGSILLRTLALIGLATAVIAVLQARRPWFRPRLAGTPSVTSIIERFPGTAVPLDRIVALVAEDHYVRMYFIDGTTRLLHLRFADALTAVEQVAGLQVHRSVWLSDAHRGEAVRRGTRWFIAAAGGIEMPTSRSRLNLLRSNGWLPGQVSRSSPLPPRN